MDLNKIYNLDCINGIKRIEDEKIDLVISDPPYFKVIGQKWDYMWKTETEYIEWSKLWLIEVERVLRKGGTFYLFGYFKILIYLIPYIESLGFKLKQQVIINKGIRAVSGRATKNYKMYPNVTESIIFFIKDPIPYSKKLLKTKQKELNLTSKEINKYLGMNTNGGGMWSIYTGKNVCEQLPTKENWEILSKLLEFDIEYSKISVTFNHQMGYTDVWDDIDFYFKNRIHPTQKPEKLIQRLILTSSNPNDIVLDPFMGSGTTAVCSKKLNRQFIGFETDKNYYENSLKRLDESI